MRTPVCLRLPGGMGGGFGGRKAGFGGIGALVVVALVALVLGVDPRLLLEGTSGGAPYSYAPGEPPSTADDELAEFVRSEEHTSELQSLMRISYAVFCLKKKKKKR